MKKHKIRKNSLAEKSIKFWKKCDLIIIALLVLLGILTLIDLIGRIAQIAAR